MNPKPPYIKGTVDCPKHGVTRTLWLAREDRPDEPLPCCIKCLAEAMVQPVRRSQEGTACIAKLFCGPSPFYKISHPALTYWVVLPLGATPEDFWKLTHELKDASIDDALLPYVVLQELGPGSNVHHPCAGPDVGSPWNWHPASLTQDERGVHLRAQ